MKGFAEMALPYLWILRYVALVERAIVGYADRYHKSSLDPHFVVGEHGAYQRLRGGEDLRLPPEAVADKAPFLDLRVDCGGPVINVCPLRDYDNLSRFLLGSIGVDGGSAIPRLGEDLVSGQFEVDRD